MTNYLLDTNICIYYLKGKFELDQKIESIGQTNCYISEITVAELKFGVENSNYPTHNRKVLNDFLGGIQTLPIFNALDFYASEKVRLRKEGCIIDEFDLLIASTAVVNNLIMVTNNQKHFERIKGIEIENWTQK